MGNEASKGCPPSSNSSYEVYKGHSSLNINSDQCDEAHEDTRVMDPGNIRYSRTHISSSFTPSILRTHRNTSTPYVSYAEVRKAAESDLLLESLLSKLRTGHTTVDTIAPIRVIFYNNSWYSLDSRRLWVYKQFGMPIPVRVTTHLDAFLQNFQRDGDNLTATFFSDIRACATIKPRPNGQDKWLLEHVFEWSIKDRMDDKFLESKVAVDSGYGRSLFERMISLKHPCHLLNIQYRMHPSISLFPNTKFYEGCLLNGDNVRGPSYRLHEDLLYGSYAFLDVSDGAEQTAHDGKSKKNLVEAAVVVAILQKLREVSKRNNICNLSVGIITPYSSQKDHLRTCLEAQKTEPLIVDINSVDGFQGQEKDVIIISTVRANKRGAIGFLEDERRLNVAITRARYCLWIVGCSKTLRGERNIWEALLKDATDREVYMRAANDTGIAKAIIKAKKEMDSYSDLLKTGSALFSNTLWKVTGLSMFDL